MKLTLLSFIMLSILLLATVYAAPVKKAEKIIKPTSTAAERIEIAMKNKDNPVKVSDADVYVLTTNKGVIKLQLFPKEAPKTSENFARLVGLGFYDGLTFHRYVENFVIQGGDPQGTGGGNSGYTVPLEAAAQHTEGALGLARGPAKDSGSCQFYITLAPQPDLDSGYTVFGKVTEGMDVVKTLRVGDKIEKIEKVEKAVTPEKVEKPAPKK